MGDSTRYATACRYCCVGRDGVVVVRVSMWTRKCVHWNRFCIGGKTNKVMHVWLILYITFDAASRRAAETKRASYGILEFTTMGQK